MRSTPQTIDHLHISNFLTLIGQLLTNQQGFDGDFSDSLSLTAFGGKTDVRSAIDAVRESARHGWSHDPQNIFLVRTFHFGTQARPREFLFR